MTKKAGPAKAKKKAKRGRPTRAAASKRALRGVDLSTVDPEQILRQIAADASAPASARLAAVRELRKSAGAVPKATEQMDHREVSPLARRALKILQGGRS